MSRAEEAKECRPLGGDWIVSEDFVVIRSDEQEAVALLPVQLALFLPPAAIPPPDTGEHSRLQMKEIRVQLIGGFKEQLEMRRSPVELENTSLELHVDVSHYLPTMADWEREKTRHLAHRDRPPERDKEPGEADGDGDSGGSAEPHEVALARGEVHMLLAERRKTEALKDLAILGGAVPPGSAGSPDVTASEQKVKDTVNAGWRPHSLRANPEYLHEHSSQSRARKNEQTWEQRPTSARSPGSLCQAGLEQCLANAKKEASPMEELPPTQVVSKDSGRRCDCCQGPRAGGGGHGTAGQQPVQEEPAVPEGLCDPVLPAAPAALRADHPGPAAADSVATFWKEEAVHMVQKTSHIPHGSPVDTSLCPIITITIITVIIVITVTTVTTVTTIIIVITVTTVTTITTVITVITVITVTTVTTVTTVITVIIVTTVTTITITITRIIIIIIRRPRAVPEALEQRYGLHSRELGADTLNRLLRLHSVMSSALPDGSVLHISPPPEEPSRDQRDNREDLPWGAQCELPPMLLDPDSDGYESSKATPSKKLGKQDSLLPPSSLRLLLTPQVREVEAELPECEESGPPAVLPGRPEAGHSHPRMAAEAGLSAQALKEHREHCPHCGHPVLQGWDREGGSGHSSPHPLEDVAPDFRDPKPSVTPEASPADRRWPHASPGKDRSVERKARGKRSPSLTWGVQLVGALVPGVQPEQQRGKFRDWPQQSYDENTLHVPEASCTFRSASRQSSAGPSRAPLLPRDVEVSACLPPAHTPSAVRAARAEHVTDIKNFDTRGDCRSTQCPSDVISRHVYLSYGWYHTLPHPWRCDIGARVPQT
ncbi:hypothetical protein J1605_019536 [Eschrichtius robustus]|uniref:Uncharacterized protein n=1 Tax=Eschrichtius robustus TaxID=9764 RepID=A0AB34HIS2_ESCRO|nr:hypothetical protein J1605_019536 [Eschrichtius robustus]